MLRKTIKTTIPICHPLTHINQEVHKLYPNAFDTQLLRWRFDGSRKWFYQFHQLPVNATLEVEFQVWETESSMVRFVRQLSEVTI